MPPPADVQLYLYFKYWRKHGVPPTEGQIKIPKGETFIDWAKPAWVVSGPVTPPVIVIDD